MGLGGVGARRGKKGKEIFTVFIEIEGFTTYF